MIGLHTNTPALLTMARVALFQLPAGFTAGVRTAMAQFEQLLTNRHFLLMLLETFESQKTFSGRDRWVRGEDVTLLLSGLPGPASADPGPMQQS